MIKKYSIAVMICLWVACYGLNAADLPRTKTRINTGWKFKLGAPEGAFYKSDTDDAAWETVHVPHTLELTSNNLNDYDDDKFQTTFQRKVGWYRKDLQVAADAKKVFLEFEGAHQVTDLWVNGQHVGQHSVGGYTPFHFDITDYVKKGATNQITLLVDNRRREDVPPDPGPFDYIKFSGLYRDVYLVTTEPVRITFNWEAMNAGVTYTTPSVDPVNLNATIDVKTHLTNESDADQELTVVNRIIDAEGLVVLKMEDAVTLAPGTATLVPQIGAIEDDLRLWSIEDPYLYRLQTSVYAAGKLVDIVACKVGMRKFEHHPREGFLLNGEPIELIGANRHQHFGYIGDALPNSLHRKDMLQFKALGFNVVRTAHYPQDNALVEACDELGILVYEEAPTWISIGNDAWFENLEKAARVMVRNHRNHPSVVIWGGGLNHRGYVPQVHLAIKQEDPTRLTASQSSRWTGWQTSGLTDIYGQMIYGPVEWYRHEPMLGMEGPEDIEVVARQKLDPLQTGLIAWNGHDYYTFHPSNGRWEDRVRPGGLMTIFRHPYGNANWFPAEQRKTPYLHFATQWTSDVDEVVIYSNAEEIALQLNGKTIARKRPDRSGVLKALAHPPFKFRVHRYEAGKLTAIGYQEGEEFVKSSIFTPEEAERIELWVDLKDRDLKASGADIVPAYAYVVDKNGTILTDWEEPIKFEIKGPASLVGDGEGINANPVKLFKGHAPVLIKSALDAGEITLTARSGKLKSTKVQFASVPANPQVAVASPFVEVSKVRVDIGGEGQLVQYGWTPWTIQDNQSEAEQAFDALGGFNAVLSPAGDGVMRSLGEMNVMGKYGYAFGEGLLVVDEQGLELRLKGLPAGDYTLRTLHHAPRSNTDSMDPNKDRLKKLNVFDIAHASRLKVISGQSSTTVRITNGKMLPEDGGAYAQISFAHDGAGDVVVKIADSEREKGIWFNGFELSRTERMLD